MATQTDMAQQVAETTCSDCYGSGYQDEEMGGEVGYIQWDCPPCDATGLRWPTLSRECGCGPYEHYYRKGKDPVCTKPGRVPDVTTDKVLDIVKEYDVGFSFFNGEWLCDVDATPVWHGEGPTPLLAACAALLET